MRLESDLCSADCVTWQVLHNHVLKSVLVSLRQDRECERLGSFVRQGKAVDVRQPAHKTTLQVLLINIAFECLSLQIITLLLRLTGGL